MDKTLTEHIAKILLQSLKETFENVFGIYLDGGTSIFETLETISAQEASQPVSGNCATVAAHVEHMSFYLDVMIQYMHGNPPQNLDWDHIWNTVSNVTADEWRASQAKLRAAYQRTREEIEAVSSWEGDHELGGALGILMHNAYHLGEMRQMLCTLKADGD